METPQGFQGFVCHATGERVTPQACLACSKHGGKAFTNGKDIEELCPFTPAIVAGLIEGNRPRGLAAWSVTELLGCPRKTHYKEAGHPFWLKPSEAFWAYRGRLAHSIVEVTNDDPRAIVELRFYAEVGGTLITGQPDVVYPATGLLQDYKTTRQVPQPQQRYVCRQCGSVIRQGQWKVKRNQSLACDACQAVYDKPDELLETLPPKPYGSHEAQLNCYRYLLARGWPEEAGGRGAAWPAGGVEANRLEIIYIAMSEPYRLSVPAWDLGDIERFLQGRLALLEARDPDGLPPGVYADEAEAWQCRYCPFAGDCPQP